MRSRPPDVWWDLEDRDGIHSVIVETTDDRYPILARYIIQGESAEPEIQRAQRLIGEVQSGRLSFKKASLLQ
jgi:F420-0:gamma-glutamyl ligase-like protein